MSSKIMTMPSPDEALPGRDDPMNVSQKHAVNGNLAVPPFPQNMEQIMIAMGCYWGAESLFWKMDGVYSTQVGFSGGYTKNPTYKEVCTGQTGHAEVVRIIYDPNKVTCSDILQAFWTKHNPTTLNSQGKDQGTQYRSGIYYYTEEQRDAAVASRDVYQDQLTQKGFGEIVTEILPVNDFYYAEDFHQQYLFKNPTGYCGLGGTGVACPIGLLKTKQ